MEDSARKIRAEVKEYILRELFPGENPESLGDDTPLLASGLLDSFQITRLVIFLERSYGIEFEAHEINADSIGTVEDLARAVQAKIREG